MWIDVALTLFRMNYYVASYLGLYNTPTVCPIDHQGAWVVVMVHIALHIYSLSHPITTRKRMGYYRCTQTVILLLAQPSTLVPHNL